MFGLFNKKPQLDDAEFQWTFAMFDWALASFGARSFYDQTILVTPTGDCFADTVRQPRLLGRGLFDRVREYAGMNDWTCDLRAGEAMQVDPGSPAERVIVFSPDQLDYPDALIARFAYELAGFLCEAAETRPPGDADARDATDVVAVFLGFGIFVCNSAAAFGRQDTDGSIWTASRPGSLPEQQLVNALSVFCGLKGIDADAVCLHLHSSLHERLHQSLAALREHEQLAMLRARQELPASPLSIPLPPGG